MYGHLNVILKTFLREKYGSNKWQSIVKKSGAAANYDTHAQYDDEVTKKLINAAVGILHIPKDNFLVMLGEFYFEYTRRIGHDELLRNLGENMLDFIENIDYVHTYMMSEYPDINMPSFRCEADSNKDMMIVHYYSFREGYHPLVIGILKQAAKVYFKSDLRIELISKRTEEVANQKGKREHVILSISVTKIKLPSTDDAPPTMVAQTKKQGEKQILREDIEHVMRRLEEIRREQGDEALPLNKARALKNKWKAIAKMSILYGGFTAQYPDKLSIDVQSFCNAFPYHMVFDKDMTIVHSGVKIQQLMPGIRDQGAQADQFFELLHPHSVTFIYAHVQKFINTPFVLRTRPEKMDRKWGNKPMVVLRGQMMYIEEHDLVLYLSSPFVRCLNDLEQRHMYIADIPIHDVTRDMLWVELMSRFKGDKEHISSGSSQSSNSPLVPMARFDPNSADVGKLRAELSRTQEALEAERQRNRTLQSSLVPRSTAEVLMSGNPPPSGQYKNVSVLFSDIVSFAQMVKSLKPSEVCDLLTDLHKKFNRLCLVHDTFRVGAIGDAYMVICGAPDQMKTHAERIANVALGMLIATEEVTSPYRYRNGFKGVQIRIGIHCGPVVAGVVGRDPPRYLVFGDTVNMASRMESHGEPGKIHVTSNFYSCLKGRGFDVEKRGKIDIRTFGSMTTYFLRANEKASTDEIMGRKPRVQTQEGVDVTFINEGRRLEPPLSRSSGTPVLLRNLVTTGHSGDNSPTNPTTPLTPPEDDYVTMTYSDSSKRK